MNYLVTAGPTREPIDPVRFLSNRSTGKMGYAVAAAAAERGHRVRLVSGPVALPTPPGVTRRDVTTAAEMARAVQEDIAWCDVLVMVAAVADWRPETVRAHKWKKQGAERAALSLVRTPDILEMVKPCKGSRIFVGFAAETREVEEEAVRKLRAKGLDLIVANDVSGDDAGFGADTNRVVFLHRDGTREALPLLSKHDVARRLLDRIESCGNPSSGR
jgi:phosphopantothenoylcysteine decarboxylase/phosphopantothenate--cysteine ligase